MSALQFPQPTQQKPISYLDKVKYASQHLFNVGYGMAANYDKRDIIALKARLESELDNMSDRMPIELNDLREYIRSPAAVPVINIIKDLFLINLYLMGRMTRDELTNRRLPADEAIDITDDNGEMSLNENSFIYVLLQLKYGHGVDLTNGLTRVEDEDIEKLARIRRKEVSRRDMEERRRLEGFEIKRAKGIKRKTNKNKLSKKMRKSNMSKKMRRNKKK